jgi:hypothetical protein
VSAAILSMRRLATLALLSGLLAAGPPPVVPIGAAQETVPDRGGTWLERRLEALVPGLRVEGLEGAWRARPTARRITLSDDRGVWLTLERVALNLAPTALVRGELRFEELDADLARLDRLPEPAAPPAPAPAPTAPARGSLFQLPELPVDVSVDRFQVERLEIDASVAGQPAAFSLEAWRRYARAACGRGSTCAASTPKGRRVWTSPWRRRRIGFQPRCRHASRQAASCPICSVCRTTHSRSTCGWQARPGARTCRSKPGSDPRWRCPWRARCAPRRTGLTAPRSRDGPARRRCCPPTSPPSPPRPSSRWTPTSPSAAPWRCARCGWRRRPARPRPAAPSIWAARRWTCAFPSTSAEAGRFAPLLPRGVAWSDLRATARVTGTLSEPAVELKRRPNPSPPASPPLDAVLGASPRLALRAALPGRTVDATLDGAEGKLAVQGDLAEPIDVTARLSLPRLSALGPGSEGSLEAVVRAEGSLSDPTVTATARSDRVEIADRVLQGLSLDARVETPCPRPGSGPTAGQAGGHAPVLGAAGPPGRRQAAARRGRGAARPGAAHRGGRARPRRARVRRHTPARSDGPRPARPAGRGGGFWRGG